MAAQSSPVPPRISPIDRHGKEIDPAVIAAAEEVYARALEHGLKLLGDPAVVVDALEQVAAAVSRLVRTEAPPGAPAIKNLPGYVFRAFVRHVSRLKRRQLVLITSNGEAGPPHWTDPSHDLELRILLHECLAQLDFVTRDMFLRRAQGFSWSEIGKIHGLSGHAAEVRFGHALRKAQVRLTTNGRMSLPCRTRLAPTDELKPAMRSNAEK
jgi:DNA-directed RNA polymerase specialized sigma24 family protein